MKKLPIIFWLAYILPISVLAELHTFRLPDGRELQAEIVGFNPYKNLVELKKENGKTASVKPDLFVAADRDYIEQWYIADVFMRNRTFAFKANKKRGDSWDENDFPHFHEYEEVCYEVILENKAKVSFENLKIEYCLYWNQDKWVEKNNVGQEMSMCGKVDIATLKASSKEIFKTEDAVLYTYNLSGEYVYAGGQEPQLHSEMRGVWLRIIIEFENGQKLVREFSTPDHLMRTVEWAGEEL